MSTESNHADRPTRIKRINHLMLYRPDTGASEAHPGPTPALTRPIRWDTVTEQHDPMIKYATAVRLGAPGAEAILRRSAKNLTHPAYSAMLEVGRAQRTIPRPIPPLPRRAA